MANAGINTNSSQFFITEVERPGLNPCLDKDGCERPYGHVPQGTGYTIFGQCDAATVALVKQIASQPCTDGPVCTQPNSRLATPVKINHIEILNAPGATTKPTAAKPSPVKPAAGKPAPPKSSATPQK
jgi:cyclophilin family peptidyl-prolyl cis-trans isomerase